MSALQPVALDQAQLAAWLGHGMSADLLARMLAVPRLEASCSRLLQERLGPWPDAPDDPAQYNSFAARTALVREFDGLALLWLAQQAGAVWNARSILKTIDGTAVRSLVNGIGAKLRLVAICHASLAPASVGGTAATGDEPADPDGLASCIARDGLGCLATWCGAQPVAVGQRLRLLLPGRGVPADPYQTHGPAIVDALLDHPS